MWVAGQESANKLGRPKGSKRSAKRNLERLALLLLTVKELKNNYDHMKPGTERWQMQKELASWLYPKAQANTLTDAEIELYYQKLEDAATKKAI